jgi:hypothetical protein
VIGRTFLETLPEKKTKFCANKKVEATTVNEKSNTFFILLSFKIYASKTWALFKVVAFNNKTQKTMHKKRSE